MARVTDLPHTISYALIYRMRIDSFSELPKEKRPPRDFWDKPYRLEQFFDEMFDNKSGSSEFIEFDADDLE